MAENGISNNQLKKSFEVYSETFECRYMDINLHEFLDDYSLENNVHGITFLLEMNVTCALSFSSVKLCHVD